MVELKPAAELGGEPDALRVLLAEARTLGESTPVLNHPADEVARRRLEALGGRVDARQHEMVLRL